MAGDRGRGEAVNPLDLKNFLWKHGYFWKYDSGKNVKVTDLHQLRLDELPVVDAVRAWQENDANFSTLSRVVHSRAVIADGGIGPVTEAMLSVPRCPMPDFPPPDGAAISSGNADFDRAIVSMQGFATGSGSWPHPGCDPQGPTANHSIRVAIDTTRTPSTIKAYLDKALAENVKAYAEVGLAVRYLLHQGNQPDCEIAKRFEPLSGSVIGWNEFPNPGTCNQTIDGRLSTGYAPSDWRMWANLECHETGHGVGLQHGNGSIMNASILLVWPMTWVGTYSFPALKRYFGGVPIAGTPTPTPPGGDYNGVFTYGGKLLKIKVWE